MTCLSGLKNFICEISSGFLRQTTLIFGILIFLSIYLFREFELKKNELNKPLFYVNCNMIVLGTSSTTR